MKTYPNYDYLADIQDILLDMDESSASEILVLLGEELITSCCTGIIERAFRCLGTELQEFLGSLDGVYDVLKFQEVIFKHHLINGTYCDTSFYPLQEEDSSDTGFVCAGDGELIFTSERPVIAWLLLGSLKALTNILFNVQVNIKIEPVEGDSRRYRYLFSLAKDGHVRETRIVKPDEGPQPRTNSTNAADLSMNSSTFCKAFPWHFIMNEDLELLQLGEYWYNYIF